MGEPGYRHRTLYESTRKIVEEMATFASRRSLSQALIWPLAYKNRLSEFAMFFLRSNARAIFRQSRCWRILQCLPRNPWGDCALHGSPGEEGFQSWLPNWRICWMRLKLGKRSQPWKQARVRAVISKP